MAISHVRKVPYQHLPIQHGEWISRNFDTVVEQLVPTGFVGAWGGKDGLDPPKGWLLCDGSAVSRAVYHHLFNVIGEQFGVGDGSTTFNLPSLNNRFLKGTTTAASAGSTGGSAVSDMPAHNHGTLTANSGSDSHSHTITVNTNSFNTGSTEPPNHTHDETGDHINDSLQGSWAGGTQRNSFSGPFHGRNTTTLGVKNSIAHVHDASHNHTGSSVADNHSHTINHTHVTQGGGGTNEPPFQVFRFIIKT